MVETVNEKVWLNYQPQQMPHIKTFQNSSAVEKAT